MGQFQNISEKIFDLENQVLLAESFLLEGDLSRTKEKLSKAKKLCADLRRINLRTDCNKQRWGSSSY